MDSWQTRLSALNMVDSYPSMQAIYICKQTLSQRFCWVCLLELLQATHLLHSSICLWKEIHFEKITCRKCFYITLILLCQLNVIISQLFLFAIHKESILWPGENVCAICTAMKSVTADVCKTLPHWARRIPKCLPQTASLTGKPARPGAAIQHKSHQQDLPRFTRVQYCCFVYRVSDCYSQLITAVNTMEYSWHKYW